MKLLFLALFVVCALAQRRQPSASICEQARQRISELGSSARSGVLIDNPDASAEENAKAQREFRILQATLRRCSTDDGANPCATVRCARLVRQCPAGTVWGKSTPQECCANACVPAPRPDCSRVSCPMFIRQPDCADGESWGAIPGQCCPGCRPSSTRPPRVMGLPRPTERPPRRMGLPRRPIDDEPPRPMGLPRRPTDEEPPRPMGLPRRPTDDEPPRPMGLPRRPTDDEPPRPMGVPIMGLVAQPDTDRPPRFGRIMGRPRPTTEHENTRPPIMGRPAPTTEEESTRPPIMGRPQPPVMGLVAQPDVDSPPRPQGLPMPSTAFQTSGHRRPPVMGRIRRDP